MQTKRKDEEVKYLSRLLACTRCGSEQETKEKQLKIDVGFRAIHCKRCGKQERLHSNKCRCDTIWHQCPTRRVDPPFHNLGRSTKRKIKDEKEIGKETET